MKCDEEGEMSPKKMLAYALLALGLFVAWCVGIGILVFWWRDVAPRTYEVYIPERGQQVVHKEVSYEEFKELELSPSYYFTSRKAQGAVMDYYGIDGNTLYHAVKDETWYRLALATDVVVQDKELVIYIAGGWLPSFILFLMGTLALLASTAYFSSIIEGLLAEEAE